MISQRSMNISITHSRHTWYVFSSLHTFVSLCVCVDTLIFYNLCFRLLLLRAQTTTHIHLQICTYTCM